MRPTLILVASCLLSALGLAQDTPPTVVFKTEKATYKAGEDIKGTVTVTFGPGLHGYQNPPSKDYMLPVRVNAGAGTVVKSVSYPKGHMEMAGGEEAAVYSGTVSFPVVIEAPKDTGKKTLNLGFFYQQCDANACYIPGTVDVSAEVTVEAAAAPNNENPTIAVGEPAVNKPAPSKAKVTLDVPPVEAEPGKVYETQITVETSGKLRLFPIELATILVEASEGTRVVNVKPSGSPQRTATGEISRFLVELELPSEPGEHKVDLTVTYRQTDQEAPFAVQTEVLSFSTTVLSPEPNDVTTPSTAGAQAPSSSTSDNGGLLGFLNNALEKGNWALIVPAALLVGLALCLTPCVFPMIPITVSFFSNQGASTSAGRFSLGFFYALGIAVTYGAVGGTAAAAGGFVGQLFTQSWFLIALGLFLVALALSMFDVYEIRLPGFIQRNLKGRSGPVGALIMGLLMGFAAAPCAGALVLAVAAKVADIGSIPTGVGMFGLIGLGMGLPFMVLAFASSGAKALPKSGGWLKTTKAALGLLVIYFAATYLFQGVGLKVGEPTTNLAWVALFGGFIVYLLFIDKTEPTRAVGTIKGVVVAVIGIFAGMTYNDYKNIVFQRELAEKRAEAGGQASDSQIVGSTINWIAYNDENFAKAVASGKPIMIDGRADWCTICHEMEARVFHTPDGLVALSGVYLLEIDWSTNVPKEYIEMTQKRFGIKGLPHVVFMEPGGKNEFSVGNIHDVEELKTHLRKVGAKL